MATALTLDELRVALRTGQTIDQWFDALRILSNGLSVASPASERELRELVIRVLDRRNELNGLSKVLDSLAIAAGLYPYADSSHLGIRDALEYETHRPPGLERFDIVFHRVQAAVYRYILQGESVILSAPTSFGKSLIIDALLASEQFCNVALVVPTLALVDETRRRISLRFGDTFKVITHPQQAQAAKNIFVMTQERIIETPEFPLIDLLVIDEFYKLDPSADADRSYLLNEAYYRLRRISSQFYLLGPSIRSVPSPLNEQAHVVVTDFSTVAVDTEKVDKAGGDGEALATLCSRLVGEPTIVFCKSPKQVRKVARLLATAAISRRPVEPILRAATWAASNYHPDWSFAQALKNGIGIHHGRLPRSLAQFVVRSFNDGELDFLVCTSTLIEGVNTAAKNVVIYDNKIATKKFDYFTFNNIRGRGGRMFAHFIGRVFLFHDPPEEVTRSIDVPAVTQPTGVKPSLLVQLDEEDLSEESRQLLDSILEPEVLPTDEIRKNHGIDPASQIRLAKHLEGLGEKQLTRLRWTGIPSFDELVMVCDLMWNYLGAKQHASEFVKTPKQLAFRLNQLRSNGFNGMLESNVEELEDADEAIEQVLDFVRSWAGFHFPRFLMAVDRIQRSVLDRVGKLPGSYTYYAAKVEALFESRAVVALDEYGIPLQISLRLAGAIDMTKDLDAVLEDLRTIPIETLHLTQFESELVRDAVARQ